MSPEKKRDPRPQTSGAPPVEPRSGWLAAAWEAVTQIGLAEVILRLGTHTLLLALILLAAWGLRAFYLGAQAGESGNAVWLSASAPTSTPAAVNVRLPDLVVHEARPAAQAQDLSAKLPVFLQPVTGIVRQANFHTDVPSRGRAEVVVYQVKDGDSLFGIAKQFGLKPESILWANQPVLGDNPHSLRPGQELNILPVDGAYHRWSAGDGLNGVAKFFNVAPEAIISFPANGLDPNTIGDLSNPNIEAGKWLVIPGGRRDYVSWSAPVIPLDNPGVAAVLGPGACESVPAGAAGAGLFVWPADNHFVTGFDYEPDANHPAIDIDGDEGQPVYAADSGVVVYAGWNNWGYGNVVVINHGNGWQTLYAHLGGFYVTCGQSVYQGNTIGAIGSTGNSDGPHLHFEMMYNGVKVNPHDYVK